MKDNKLDSGEKRVARRFPVGWPVRVIGLDATGIHFEETSLAKDLSSTGVFVSLSRPIPVGSELQVLIKVPLGEEHWMSYPGHVVRTAPDRTEQTGQVGQPERGERGVAIRFSSAKPNFLKD
ncbi:MAG TPA: PilZ domain-containing protein [Blastocatellia bacterium]